MGIVWAFCGELKGHWQKYFMNLLKGIRRFLKSCFWKAHNKSFASKSSWKDGLLLV